MSHRSQLPNTDAAKEGHEDKRREAGKPSTSRQTTQVMIHAEAFVIIYTICLGCQNGFSFFGICLVCMSLLFPPQLPHVGFVSLWLPIK